MKQTIASVAELAPGDTYSRELGGTRFTIHAIRKAKAPDPFGRDLYEIATAPDSAVLLLASDDVWRDQ